MEANECRETNESNQVDATQADSFNSNAADQTYTALFAEEIGLEPVQKPDNNGSTQNIMDSDSGRMKVSIAIQANDYEIERRSGKNPARRRVIPTKFRDYRDPERSEDEDSDEDYDPENEIKKSVQLHSRRRGRPRKYKDSDDGTQEILDAESSGNEPVASKTTKTGSRPRGRPKSHSGRFTEKQFPCEECDKKFSQKGNLKAHMLVHTNEKPFKCTYEGCGKEYRTNLLLKMHLAKHIGTKLYECPHCAKKLATNISLKEHILIHTNDRPNICKICEKSFRQLSALTKHLAIHSSALPYTCATCGKQFAAQAYLKSHSKVHTGERPFVCQTCNKSFAHGSDLSRHKTVHTKEKPYACEQCGARFSDPSSRRRHMKEHVGVKPYSCQLCGDAFKRAGQLKVHLNRKHTFEEDVKISKGPNNSLQFSFKGGNQLVTIREALQSPAHVDLKALELQKKIVKQLQKPSTGNVYFSTKPNTAVYHIVQDVQGSSSLQPIVISPSQGQEGSPEKHVEDSFSSMISGDQQSVITTMLQLSQPTMLHSPNLLNNDQQNTESTKATKDISSIASSTGTVMTQETSAHENADAANSVEMPQDSNVSVVQSESTAVHEVVLNVAQNSSDKLQEKNHISAQHQQQPVEIEYHIVSFDEAGQEISSTCSSEVVQELVKQAVGVSVTNQEDKTSNPQQQTISTQGISGIDYVTNPDFSSQEYYDWLSNFAELCKLVNMPLNVDLFTKISQVQKTLTDVLASPTGVLTKRENFQILMNISKELNVIANEHLAYILQNLDSQATND